jgi:AcrR family transcriptional regulator
MTPAELDPDDLTLTKAPQQARSRRTLERLREAAWDLLEQEGVEALTITGVSAGAGVSVGSFYARFEGKEELLDHLEAVALEAAIRSWTEAVDAARTTRAGGGEETETGIVEARFEDLLAHLLHLYRRGPARRLLLLSRADGRSADRLNHLNQAVAEALAQIITPQEAGEDGHPPAYQVPGSPELLRGAALAAAARELALAVEGPSREWLFGDAPDAGVDRRILQALLTLVQPTPSAPEPPVRHEVTELEDPGEVSPEAPDEDPPSPAVELFDIWG